MSEEASKYSEPSRRSIDALTLATGDMLHMLEQQGFPTEPCYLGTALQESVAGVDQASYQTFVRTTQRDEIGQQQIIVGLQHILHRPQHVYTVPEESALYTQASQDNVNRYGVSYIVVTVTRVEGSFCGTGGYGNQLLHSAEDFVGIHPPMMSTVELRIVLQSGITGDSLESGFTVAYPDNIMPYNRATFGDDIFYQYMIALLQNVVRICYGDTRQNSLPDAS